MPTKGRHHILFSAENPRVTPSMHMDHEETLQMLKDRGENATEVIGRYGKPEKSIMVLDPKDSKFIHHLAAALGQESGLESKGGMHKLHFYNGPDKDKIVTGFGTKTYDSPPHNNYTQYGDQIFSHNLDFGDDSPVNLVHYSKTPGLTKLDPSYLGTGVTGNMVKRGAPKIKYSQFYRKDTPTEDLVTNQANALYSASIPSQDHIYDLGSDPKGILKDLKTKFSTRQVNPVPNTDDYLGAVRDAGYKGFWNSNHPFPGAVALFHPTDVKEDKIYSAAKSMKKLGKSFDRLENAIKLAQKL